MQFWPYNPSHRRNYQSGYRDKRRKEYFTLGMFKGDEKKESSYLVLPGSVVFPCCQIVSSPTFPRPFKVPTAISKYRTATQRAMFSFENVLHSEGDVIVTQVGGLGAADRSVNSFKIFLNFNKTFHEFFVLQFSS